MKYYKYITDSVFRLVQGRTYIQFLFSLGYVFVIILTQPLAYNANDNISIMRALEVGLESPFMSILLGKLLSFLYLHVGPDFPWYSFFLYITHVVSVSLFLSAAFSLEKVKYYALPFIVAYLSFYSVFIMRVGFNSAAIMIGAHSLFAFIVSQLSENKVSRIKSVVYGFLFTFSYLIRLDGIMAVFVFSIPVIAISFLDSLRTKKYFSYILFTVPVVLLILFNVFAEHTFTSEQYRAYAEFNKIRGQFNAYPISSANIGNFELYEKNNWSANDYQALMRWVFPNEQKYNVHTLGNIFSYPAKSDQLLEKFEDRLTLFVDQYSRSVPLLYLTVFISLIAGFHLRVLPIYLLYLLYAHFGMIYMHVFYRFPARIGIPILLLCSVNILYLMFRDQVYDGSKMSSVVANDSKKSMWAMFASVVIVAWGLTGVGCEREIIKKGRDSAGKLLNEINALPEGSYIINEPRKGIRYEYLNPLKTYSEQVRRNIVPLGWPIFSPYFYYTLSEAGLSRGDQLLPSLVDNQRAYLMLSTDSFKEIVQLQIENETGVKCIIKRIQYFSDDTSLYQVVSGTDSRFFSWPLFTPLIIKDGTFPWQDYFSKKSFMWSGKIESP